MISFKLMPLLVLLTSLAVADELENRLSEYPAAPTKVFSNDSVLVKLFISQNEAKHIKTVVESTGGRLHSTWESGEMQFEDTKTHDKWTEEVDDVAVYWPNGSKRLNVRYFNRSIETSGKALSFSLWDPRGNLELHYSNRNFKNFSAQIMDGVSGSTPFLRAGSDTHELKGEPNGRFVVFVVDPHLVKNREVLSLENVSMVEGQEVNQPTDPPVDGLYPAFEGFIEGQRVEGALKTYFHLGEDLLSVDESYDQGTREGVMSLQLYPFDLGSLPFRGGKPEGRAVMFPIFSGNELMVLGSGEFRSGYQVGAWEEYASWEYRSGCWLRVVKKGEYVAGKRNGRWTRAIEDQDCGEPDNFSTEEFWDHGKWIERDEFILKRTVK